MSRGPEVPVTAVNLLSPWVMTEMRVRKLRERFGIGALALLVALGGFWGFQRLQLAQAEADLRGEEAVTADLTRRTEALAPVRAYVGDVRRHAETVQATMATEVSFAAVLRTLRASAPAGTTVETASVVLPVPGAATTAAGDAAPSAAGTPETRGLADGSCPGPDPFGTKPVVGCVTLAGTSVSRAAVGAFVVRLSRSELFVEPFISTTTTDEAAGRVSFAGSVALSPAVFTGRYDGLVARLLDEEEGS